MLHQPDDELEPHTLRFSSKVSMDIIPTFASRRTYRAAQPRHETCARRPAELRRDHHRLRAGPAGGGHAAIAPHTDGIIFAASLLDSDRRSITAALELLQRLGLNLLGIVATNVPERPFRTERGRLRYGYGTAARAEADPAPRA